MELYKVIIAGEVLPGVARDRATANLAALFKIDYTKADSFFSNKPVIVKKGLPLPKAESYKKAIEKAGVVCLVELAVNSTAEPGESDPSTPVVPIPKEKPRPLEEATSRKEDLIALQQETGAHTIYIGFWARFVASIIDNVLITIIIVPPLFFFFAQGYSPVDLLMGGGGGDGFMVIGTAIIEIIVWISISTTPGKMLFKGVIVDSKTGRKPSAMQFTIRYIGYYISMLPLFFGFLWIAFDNRKQGWHDKIANTVVVKKSGTKKISKMTIFLFVIIFLLSVGMLGFVGVQAGKNWWATNKEVLKNKAMEVKGEADDFGKERDNQACIDEAIQRDLDCKGFKCSIKNTLFLSFCLQASALTPGFCDSVPSKDEFMETITWRLRRCVALNHSGNSCNELFGTVQDYCYSDGLDDVEEDGDVMDEIEKILSEKK